MEQNNLSIFHKGFNKYYQKIPFIWSYNDILMPYEVYKCNKLTKDEFKNIINKKKSIELDKILETLEDNTEYYYNIQYKKQDIWYMNRYNNELYISFHTWLFHKDTGLNYINNSKGIKKSYDMEVAIFPFDGSYKTTINYPHKIIFNKKGKAFIAHSGIGIKQFDKRVSIIHYTGEYVKFSPFDQCNFRINNNSSNITFVSIIKSKFGNCVTFHIFRNVMDDNPNDEDFQKLVNFYIIS